MNKFFTGLLSLCLLLAAQVASATTYNGFKVNWSTGSATTIATSAAQSVAVGDAVHVGVSHQFITASTTCADNLGNTYTQKANLTHTSGEPTLTLFESIITSAGSATITCTFASAQTFRGVVAHFFSPTGGSTFSSDSPGQAIAGGNSAAPSSGSYTASAAGAASAFFALYNSVITSETAGSGWTKVVSDDTLYGDQFSEYRLPSGSGSITGDFAWHNTDFWVAGAINTKETAGGGSSKLAIIIPQF